MKPLISYYGGKQRIASKILPHFPRHTVYVEPFAGGAALLFAKPKPLVTDNSHYREVLNDTSDLLINLYRVAIKQRQELETEIMATLYSQSDHLRSKEIIKNPSKYDNLTKAWAFYVNINQSFCNQLNTGWGTNCYSQNLSISWRNKQLRLHEILNRIKDIHVSCEDAIKCIERWDSPQTLFYCDPPYPGANQGHYSGYTLEDFKNLCDVLDNIKGSYVLSNYPQSIEPKSAQKRVEIDATMSASKATKKNNKRIEVLWICDRSEGMRNELKSLPLFCPTNQLSLL